MGWMVFFFMYEEEVFGSVLMMEDGLKALGCG